MSEPWMPGAVWDPGKGAGYAVGRNEMRLVCMHCTAGTNSYDIVKNGTAGAPSTLAQFLVPKDGPPWQFTEVDALCYDSPPNRDGPGIEIERMSAGVPTRPGLSGWEELTSSQVEWTGRIVHWLNSEWGVPLDLYDGPRTHGIGVPGFHGFANHGDVDNQRSDGVTVEEWAALVGAAPAPPSTFKKGSKGMSILIDYATQRCWLMVGNVRVQDFDWTPAGAFGIPQQALDYDNGRGLIMAVGTAQLDLVDRVSKALIALA